MGERQRLEVEIIELKALLVRTAEQYQYNFLHPKVLALSEKLDFLILETMKPITPLSRVKAIKPIRTLKP